MRRITAAWNAISREFHGEQDGLRSSKIRAVDQRRIISRLKHRGQAKSGLPASSRAAAATHDRKQARSS
jgi:hypothetical protein